MFFLRTPLKDILHPDEGIINQECGRWDMNTLSAEEMVEKIFGVKLRESRMTIKLQMQEASSLRVGASQRSLRRIL